MHLTNINKYKEISSTTHLQTLLMCIWEKHKILMLWQQFSPCHKYMLQCHFLLWVLFHSRFQFLLGMTYQFVVTLSTTPNMRTLDISTTELVLWNHSRGSTFWTAATLKAWIRIHQQVFGCTHSLLKASMEWDLLLFRGKQTLSSPRKASTRTSPCSKARCLRLFLTRADPSTKSSSIECRPGSSWSI